MTQQSGDQRLFVRLGMLVKVHIRKVVARARFGRLQRARRDTFNESSTGAQMALDDDGSNAWQHHDVDALAVQVARQLERNPHTVLEHPLVFVLRAAANAAALQQEGAADEAQAEGSAETAVQPSLQDLVDQLPPRRRRVLLLYVNDGLTHFEIAKRLHLDPRFVRRQLASAYSFLRLRIEPDMQRE